MRENIIKTKFFDFALRIVKLYKYLFSEKKKFVLSKQLLRLAISVSANVRVSFNYFLTNAKSQLFLSCLS
jgi:four helix bundle protein